MARKIAFINQKGGVGKSTLTTHIGAYLAKKGNKVLLIDADPQRDLSQNLGLFDEEVDNYSIYNFLLGEGSFSPVGIEKNLHLVDGYSELLEVTLTKKMLSKAIENIEHNFDYILIDCQPQPIIKSRLTLNEIVLNAVDYVCIPTDPNTNSVSAVFKISTSINRIKTESNPNLQIAGIVFSIVSENETIFKDTYKVVEDTAGDFLMKNYIRKNTQIKHASAIGQTIYSFDNKSKSCKDFDKVGKELIERIEKIA
ncbi:ParA family protein [Myroides injenensis]|uniref:AAA domain-containing protein n=2 Tax=Flavobacteriaceae TaxID=49546 RepID=A0AAI8G736_9FLAO|nr:ParA family protein [Myroides injenensis]ALU28446.1 hypothetical protein AS202_19895 [Myroides odoratimimus]